MILGIDEAGRGPVIGPMVIAGLLIEEKEEEVLKEKGIRDSKMILRSKREQLYNWLIKRYTYKYIIISPKEIDFAVKSKNTNLNWLEADKTIEIINDFRHIRPDKIYVDCPSNNISSYRDYIKKKLSFSPELIVEHGADKKYVVVGGASIIAKVVRDKIIEKLKEEIGVDFGSGYPSDPLTQEFIKNIKNTKAIDREIVRRSWSTYKKEDKSLKDFF